MSFSVTDNTTLGELLALKIHMFEDDVCKVVEQAVKEMAIEKVFFHLRLFLTSI